MFHCLYLLHDASHHPHNLLITSIIGLSEDATKASTTADTTIAIRDGNVDVSLLALLTFFYLYHLKRTAEKTKRIQKCPSCV